MRHHNAKLCRERGPVQVILDYEGEGYKGRFDPSDPEDTMLMRFYCSVKDENTALMIAFETRRTCLAAETPLEVKAAVLEVLLHRFYDSYANHQEDALCLLADELSSISADNYPSYLLTDA